MSRNPFGWDLPPGVTDKMIDEAMGGNEVPWQWECEACGNSEEKLEEQDLPDACPNCGTNDQEMFRCWEMEPEEPDPDRQYEERRERQWKD